MFRSSTKRALLGALLLVPTLGLPGCSLFTPGNVKTVLDVAQYACITANADLPSEGEIAKVCGIAEVLIPAIKTVVDDFKTKRAAYAEAQLRAAHCGR